MLVAITCAACLSPVTLKRAVNAYDAAVTDAMSQQLLINIARARYRDPIHFSGVSNIAATFDFRVSAGGTPAFTGDSGSTIVPTFGGSMAENPTISIVPIEAEEFTKRLLTPFKEDKFILLLRQRFDLDLLLRLMAQELLLTENGGERAYRNTPAEQSEYELFRRVVLHLSSIQDRNHLYVEPLTSSRTWRLPAATVTPEGFRALENEYLVSLDDKTGDYMLRKLTTGRFIITNYDLAVLSREERHRLMEEVEQGHFGDVFFDIRSGYIGGEYSLKGFFRLRSFNTILGFVGRSLEDDPEYHVDPDPRTPPVAENPIHTIEVLIGKQPSSSWELTADYRGESYAVRTDGPSARWNREAFQLIYLLFQMTVGEVPRLGVPSITIAK